MKRIFIYILLIIAASCETEKIIFKGPYHVRFTDAALTEKESNSSIIKIEVHNAGPALEEDVTLSYSISGNAREHIDYEILGTRGKVTINAGEYFGYIEVQLINNANNIIRSQNVVFTLTRVNSSKLEVGQGEGGIGEKFTFTILDDCILGGIYTGTRDNSSVEEGGIELTSTDCEIYHVSNWNIDDVFNLNHTLGFSLNFIDNGDNTLTIPIQKPPEFFDDEKEIQGTGSVNPITREIRLIIQYEDLESIITLIPE